MHIPRLTTSHAPVFLINSRLPLVSAALTPSTQHVGLRVRAPLLPKLRGHFAEFLNYDCLDRLSILYLTTCVGFGYGQHHTWRRCFSRQHRITESPPTGAPITSQAQCLADLPTRRPTRLDQVNSTAWLGYLPASHLLMRLTLRIRSQPPHQQQPEGCNRWFGWLVSPHHHGRCSTGTGISTRSPSTTPVGLALGPD